MRISNRYVIRGEMKVLLYKPYFPDIAILPPMGLCYMAAILEKNNISVEILDNTLSNLTREDLREIIKRNDYNIVGIYSSTPMINNALSDAKLFKETKPDIHVSLGGPHPSETIDETLSSLYVDSIGIGEGEYTFLELIKNIINSQNIEETKGFAFKTSNGVRINNPVGFIENLDLLPFPAFHLLPIEKYFEKRKKFGILQKETRNLPIIATRGCPSGCTFCQRFLGNKLRKRSPKNIADEIIYHSKEYRVNDFNFLDDNFTFHEDWAIEVCRELKKRNFNMGFHFPNGVREDRLDKELLLELRSAGCYHLDFGIESGSQKVLNIMRKGKTLEKIREKVLLAHESGFKLSANFIFGTPGETKEDMLKTINFALSLPLDSASFGIVIPFPGTQIRKEAIENGYLVHSDYNKYNPVLAEVDPPLKTADWDGKDLRKMLILAYRKFYFRPKYVIKAIQQIFKGKNLKEYFSAFQSIIIKRY